MKIVKDLMFFSVIYALLACVNCYWWYQTGEPFYILFTGLFMGILFVMLMFIPAIHSSEKLINSYEKLNQSSRELIRKLTFSKTNGTIKKT